jgi:hypothetical protein
VRECSRWGACCQAWSSSSTQVRSGSSAPKSVLATASFSSRHQRSMGLSSGQRGGQIDGHEPLGPAQPLCPVRAGVVHEQHMDFAWVFVRGRRRTGPRTPAGSRRPWWAIPKQNSPRFGVRPRQRARSSRSAARRGRSVLRPTKSAADVKPCAGQSGSHPAPRAAAAGLGARR